MEVTIEEQRAFVKIMTLRQIRPTEIREALVEACGESAMALRTVQKWVQRFQSGDGCIEDASRSGRPPTACVDESVRKVNALMENERRWTCTEIAESLDLSKSSVHRILTDHLNMRKLSARWVPHNLTNDQKSERVRISRHLLRRHQQDGDFLDRIIAIDESWVRSYEPELKRQSAEWRHQGSPRPVKFRQKPSAVKLMLIAAYDSSGIVLSHYVPPGETVTASYYSNYLRVHLRQAIRRKRPNLQIPLILHDNAAAHRAAFTQETLQDLGWECLPHPPYSPDLSPPDFDLFGKLKEPLRGKRFNDLDEVKNASNSVLRSLSSSGALNGISKLPHRWEKVIALRGDYIEG